jgi:hypothetical protein
MSSQFEALSTAIQTMSTELRAEVGSVRTEVGSVRTEVGSVRTEVGTLSVKVEAVTKTRKFVCIHTSVYHALSKQSPPMLLRSSMSEPCKTQELFLCRK